VRAGIGRLGRDSAAEQRLRLLILLALDLADEAERAHDEPPRIDAVGRLARGAVALFGIKVRLDRGDDALGNVVLHREDVMQVAIVFLGPDMLAGFRVDELSGDADLLARRAHAAFEHVAHTEIARDLAHIDRLAFVDEGGIAGDHEQPAQPRQRRDDVLGNTVGDEILGWIAAEKDEGQHGDRWHVHRLEDGGPLFLGGR